MKTTIMFLIGLMLLSFAASAQTHQIGIGVGASNFMGDLGKRKPNGNTYLSNITASLFRPAVSGFYRFNFNQRISIRGNLSYGVIEGNDALVESKKRGESGWFRHNRNLHFKSRLIEASIMGEFHLLPYEPGSKKKRITPFLFGGVGMFFFNPKAIYEGEWVALQPLGTEGQGLPDYPNREKYSLVQPSFTLGFGIKYNIDQHLSIEWEIGHRFTLTDYIDDVSKTYAKPQAFDRHYDEQQAEMIKDLADRRLNRDQLEGGGSHQGVSRGNPSVNDQYIFTMVSIAYNFNGL